MTGRRFLRVAIALAVGLALVVVPAAGLAAAPTTTALSPNTWLPSEGLFPDVPFTDGGADRAAAFLARQGIMQGFPDLSFRPEGLLTRAEMAKIMATAMGLAPSSAAPQFKDAAAIPAWARPYVSAAVDAKLLAGYPDGTFRAGATVTEAQVLTVLVRALGDGAYVAKLDAQGSHWPDDYVNAAQTFNLAGGRIPPPVVAGAAATRAWTAAIVDNALHGVAEYTVSVGGRPYVNPTGGVWGLNFWKGVRPAIAEGTVTALSSDSIAISVEKKAYPAGGRVPIDASYPLESNVLFAGGLMSASDLKVGDPVSLAVDAAGKVDSISGSGHAVATACAPTFKAQQITSSTILVPIRLSGPDGSFGMLALATTVSPITYFDTAVLKQLGYVPGTKSFRVPLPNSTTLTGSVYTINTPEVWAGHAWYPLSLQQTPVAGIDDLSQFGLGPWRAVIGEDLLAHFKITQQNGVWTVTPPCVTTQPTA